MSRVYGYARKSTAKQKIERQIDNIERAFPAAIIYQETYTGTKMHGRPEFEKLLKKVQSGDTIVFDSVSRMSRNSVEGVQTYFDLYDKGVNLVFLKERHIDTAFYDEQKARGLQKVASTGHAATDKLVAAFVDAMNEYIKDNAVEQIKIAFDQSQKEVDDLRQRTKEGLAQAKKRGSQIGAAKGRTYETQKAKMAKEKIKKHNKTFGGTLDNEETRKLAGISHVTFYKYKQELIEEFNSTHEK